jgi:hypothetical protein
VLLSRQHKNRENQLRRQEHLDEQPLRHTRTAAEFCLHIQRAGEHALHERTRRQPAQNLRDEEQSTSNPGQSADQAHPEGDRRVEEPAADTEEDPGVDRQAEAEGQGDVLQLLRVGAGLIDGQAGGGGD